MTWPKDNILTRPGELALQFVYVLDGEIEFSIPLQGKATWVLGPESVAATLSVEMKCKL